MYDWHVRVGCSLERRQIGSWYLYVLTKLPYRDCAMRLVMAFRRTVVELRHS